MAGLTKAARAEKAARELATAPSDGKIIAIEPATLQFESREPSERTEWLQVAGHALPLIHDDMQRRAKNSGPVDPLDVVDKIIERANKKWPREKPE